jgi:ribonucleoside-diphosphate reductase alpha chain
MANCWRVWGERYGYFASKNDAQVFYDELVYSILNQACVPNSPQWFNTGLHESYGITGKPQGHYYVDPKDKKIKEINQCLRASPATRLFYPERER